MNKLSFSRPDSSVPGEIFPTPPDMKCHNWCKFKWPWLRSHCILRFCKKHCGSYKLWVKKKQTSLGLEASKSRISISSCIDGGWKTCERCHKDSHFQMQFSANVFPGGKVCEPGSWTVDSVPSLPRGDRTQWGKPSWSQLGLNLILNCLEQTPDL